MNPKLRASKRVLEGSPFILWKVDFFRLDISRYDHTKMQKISLNIIMNM